MGIKQPVTGLWSLPENLFPQSAGSANCDVHLVESLFKHVLESANNYISGRILPVSIEFH